MQRSAICTRFGVAPWTARDGYLKLAQLELRLHDGLTIPHDAHVVEILDGKSNRFLRINVEDDLDGAALPAFRATHNRDSFATAERVAYKALVQKGREFFAAVR